MKKLLHGLSKIIVWGSQKLHEATFWSVRQNAICYKEHDQNKRKLHRKAQTSPNDQEYVIGPLEDPIIQLSSSQFICH